MRRGVAAVLGSRALWGTWLGLALVASCAGAQVPDRTLTMHFERVGLPVPEFTFTLRADGSGRYRATYAAPPPDAKYGPVSAANAVAAARPSAQATQAFRISRETTATLFDHVRQADRFRGGCETRMKNVANSGTKTLTYTGPDGDGGCTFNYADNKAVGAIAETIQAIAETMDEGRAIALKHRFDRLGLDHEMTNLVDAMHDGRAKEVMTIAPILQSLCDDPQVLERVRKRAAGLLEASANQAAK
jgi:hypothetical protein